MRVVDRPYTRPNACAAKPHIGQTAEGERWVDTGAELNGFDNHVYLCETSVREAAAALDLTLVDDEEYVAVIREAEAANLVAAKLQAELDELRAFKDSVYIAIGRKPEHGEPPEPKTEPKP